MEILPTEIQELVCSLIGPDSLLQACRVCRTWNIIISSQQRVWRSACVKIGSGAVCVDNWKELYISCRRTLHALERGTAFKRINLSAESFRGSAIRGLEYCDGHLLVGIHNAVRVWNMDTTQAVGEFAVPYKLTCLGASSGECLLLAAGQHQGIITTWELNVCGCFAARRVQTLYGHIGPVTDICVEQRLDLLCSGSVDRSVRAWSLSSGSPLWLFPLQNSVLQVRIAPCSRALVVAEESTIHRYVWCENDLKKLQELKPQLSVTRGRFLLHGQYLAYCQNNYIVVQDLHSLARLCRLLVESSGIDLIGLGERFLLMAVWDIHCKKYEAITLDWQRKHPLGSYPMPL